jgi:hypothetical protein
LTLDTMIARAWPLFVRAVRQGQTLTYSEVAAAVGPPVTRRGVHRRLLIPLSERCCAVGAPPLAALVVRKDTGKPGGGWLEPNSRRDPDEAWAEDLARVFAYPWPAKPDAFLAAGKRHKRQ